jgi:hypothetical protein
MSAFQILAQLFDATDWVEGTKEGEQRVLVYEAGRCERRICGQSRGKKAETIRQVYYCRGGGRSE